MIYPEIHDTTPCRLASAQLNHSVKSEYIWYKETISFIGLPPRRRRPRNDSITISSGRRLLLPVLVVSLTEALPGQRASSAPSRTSRTATGDRIPVGFRNRQAGINTICTYGSSASYLFGSLGSPLCITPCYRFYIRDHPESWLYRSQGGRNRNCAFFAYQDRDPPCY